MTRYGKILAVLVAVAAIAFMAFAGAATRGGPHWEAMAQSLEGYQFTRSTGENPQWTVSTARGEDLKTAKVLPDAILAALQDISQKQQEELSTLSEKQPVLENQLAEMERKTAADIEALERHVAEQQQFLNQMRQQYLALSREVVQKTEQAQQVEAVVQARRGDVFRLQNQAEVVRADQYRIAQIQQQMRDLLQQIDANLERARARRDQLLRRLEGYGDQPEDAAAN